MSGLAVVSIGGKDVQFSSTRPFYSCLSIPCTRRATIGPASWEYLKSFPCVSVWRRRNFRRLFARARKTSSYFLNTRRAVDNVGNDVTWSSFYIRATLLQNKHQRVFSENIHNVHRRRMHEKPVGNLHIQKNETTNTNRPDHLFFLLQDSNYLYCIRRCPSHMFRMWNNEICCGTNYAKIRSPTIFPNGKRVIYLHWVLRYWKA